MPRMKEHIDAGFAASIPLFFSVLWMHKAGVIGWHDFVGFATFGSAALILGSDLPDVDAKTAPINRLFVALVPGSVLLAMLGALRMPLGASVLAALFSLVAFVKLMPPHRKFVHTVRAGLLMEAISTFSLVLLGFSINLGLWTGFSLFVGYLIHLWKDRWIRI